MILKETVTKEQVGMRLDDGARALFTRLSKGEIRRIIDRGGCTVSGVLVRVASRTLAEGDEIAIGVMEGERFTDLAYTAGDMLFEDREYLAVNKRAGINSQRTPYQLKGTVEYAVEQYLKARGVNEPARVIHRLDIGTSGVMFFPKKKGVATHVSALLKDGKVEKRYWALVEGSPQGDEWREEGAIARVAKFRYGVAAKGMKATTVFRVILRGRGAALVEARPLTGRTHQIRVHLAHIGLPVIGDQAYGGPPAPRMMLHCRFMSFRAANGRPISATAPVDGDFIKVCAEYGIVPDQLII